jgi:hypothetical protein
MNKDVSTTRVAGDALSIEQLLLMVQEYVPASFPVTWLITSDEAVAPEILALFEMLMPFLNHW